MKKIIKQRIIISLSFILTLLLGYAYIGMILMPKDYDDLGGSKYYAAMGYKAEKKDTIDIAICGNSDVYSGFTPIEFYRQTGITSYNCSAANQPAISVEKNIKYLVEHQDLKLVIIDVDCLFSKNTYGKGISAYEYANLIAPFKYHARWKELEFKDFYTLPKIKSDPFKGFIPNAKKIKYSLPKDYMTDINALPHNIESSVIKNVKNIAKICDKNDIELLFLCLPTPRSWSNAKSNAIANLAMDLNVPFLDLNLPQDGFNLDYSSSYRDKGNHLNVFGATYTTIYLAKYISNHYELSDHRNEEKYKDWNELIPVYDTYVENLIEKSKK